MPEPLYAPKLGPGPAPETNVPIQLGSVLGAGAQPSPAAVPHVQPYVPNALPAGPTSLPPELTAAPVPAAPPAPAPIPTAAPAGGPDAWLRRNMTGPVDSAMRWATSPKPGLTQAWEAYNTTPRLHVSPGRAGFTEPPVKVPYQTLGLDTPAGIAATALPATKLQALGQGVSRLGRAVGIGGRAAPEVGVAATAGRQLPQVLGAAERAAVPAAETAGPAAAQAAPRTALGVARDADYVTGLGGAINQARGAVNVGRGLLGAGPGVRTGLGQVARDADYVTGLGGAINQARGAVNVGRGLLGAGPGVRTGLGQVARGYGQTVVPMAATFGGQAARNNSADPSTWAPGTTADRFNRDAVMSGDATGMYAHGLTAPAAAAAKSLGLTTNPRTPGLGEYVAGNVSGAYDAARGLINNRQVLADAAGRVAARAGQHVESKFDEAVPPPRPVLGAGPEPAAEQPQPAAGSTPAEPGTPQLPPEVAAHVPPEQLQAAGTGAAQAVAQAGSLPAAVEAAAHAPPPPGFQAYWSGLDSQSKFLAIAGLSITAITALKSAFGGDDEEGGSSFLMRLAPFLGLGAAAWGLGGGTLSSLPKGDTYKQLWNAAKTNVGDLGFRLGAGPPAATALQ